MFKCTLCGAILEPDDCIFTPSWDRSETFVTCPKCNGECVDYDEDAEAENSSDDEERFNEEEALYYGSLPSASDINVLNKAICINGCDRQIDVAIEEMSELIQALIKERRNSTVETREHVSEEMADVVVVLHELQIIFDNKECVGEYIKRKTERLKARLEENKSA